MTRKGIEQLRPAEKGNEMAWKGFARRRNGMALNGRAVNSATRCKNRRIKMPEDVKKQLDKAL